MTPTDAAKWMVQELEHVKWLDQDHVAAHLSDAAPGLVYINDNGNYGIDKRVLSAFKAMTPDVVWSRSERHWRKREDCDEPGKREQD